MEINYNSLGIDEAYVNIKNSNSDISIYGQSADCERCMFKHVANIKGNLTKLISVSTKRESIWRVYLEGKYEETKSINSTPFCEIPTNFGQFGIYDFNVKEDSCKLNVVKEPVNIYIPLIGVAVVTVVLYFLVSFLVKYLCKPSRSSVETEEGGSICKNRIKSVDTFRGIALFFMIFCNNGGGEYWFFKHSTWDGILPADLLFPWFIWIMGLCIALSAHSPVRSITKSRDVFLDILKRSLILFILGVALNTLDTEIIEFKNIIVMGVLQRIAISYFVTAIIANFFSIKKLSSIVYPKTWYSKLLYIFPQWILHLSILGLHYGLTFYLDVPSCPRGYLGVGGIQDDGLYKNCTGGSAGYIDQIILGQSHILKYWPISNTYKASVFQPENLLGCLTTVFQAFLGYHAGLVLKWNKKPLGRILWWIIFGIICIALYFSSYTYLQIPINKSLWSISYVFITSGLAFFLLTFCYIFNDWLQYWSGGPFIFLGMNSIIVYVGHELCYQMFPWHWNIPPMNTHLLYLLENLWSVFLWVFISIWLHKKKFYLSI